MADESPMASWNLEMELRMKSRKTQMDTKAFPVLETDACIVWIKILNQIMPVHTNRFAWKALPEGIIRKTNKIEKNH